MLGLGKRDLSLDEGAADIGLARGRHAVARRTPRHDIAEQNAFARQPDAGEHAVEHVAEPTRERLAVAIVIRIGHGADDHDAV
ncbi:hypothetical protein D3C87_2014850 [compost metagenome]